MWDINDGRCFNISAHNIFNDDDEITKIELLTASECRYLACISKINLYLRIIKTSPEGPLQPLIPPKSLFMNN